MVCTRPAYSFENRAGVCSMEVYVPQMFVSQADMEKFDKVSSGKYLKGLGQTSMAFVSDLEDPCSMAMSCVASLMERDDLDYCDIGRLSVSTESQIDHSKSIKSVLMQLFEESGNSDVEGVDLVNACYSGTQGLFDALAWVDSPDWDGRYALVVAVDVAEYAPGPARPTGGAGAAAILVGRENVALYVEPLRASHMQHAYDFYKPNLSSPYPTVDGKHSNYCFLNAFDRCYQLLDKKSRSRNGQGFRASGFDYFLCHSPYTKLVQKTFARVSYNDSRLAKLAGEKESFPEELKAYKETPLNETYTDRDFANIIKGLSKDDFDKKASPCLGLAKEVGNIYSASILFGMYSLLASSANKLAGKRALAFSYGSGLCSTLYVLRGNDSPTGKAALARLGRVCKATTMGLNKRSQKTPEEYTATMERREKLYGLPDAWTPEGNFNDLRWGTYFVAGQDAMSRRVYQRKSIEQVEACNHL